MGLSKQYTDDRLDRLAGAIRDEAASRRGDISNLRLNLDTQISDLRRETTKEDNALWRLLAVGVGLVFLLSVCAPKANAAPLMSSPSSRHHAPASVALQRFRTDRRLDDLNRKIDAGSSRTAENLQHLRSRMKVGLEELEEDTKKRELILLMFAGGVAVWLLFSYFVLKL